MRKVKATVLRHEREIEELAADRELAVEYLKAAVQSLDNPDDRAAGLPALRAVAEAYYAQREKLGFPGLKTAGMTQEVA